MWLLLASMSFCFLKVSCQYVLGVGNWTNAKQSCNLARPNITFSETENTVEFGLDMLEDGQKAWIGYTMTSEIFQYIGCVKVSNISSSKYEKIGTAHDPGQCFSACKHSKAFGIRTLGSSDCFCFETDAGHVKYTQNQCDSLCDNDLFSCGGSSFISLYTPIQIQNNKTGADKCLAYTIPGRSYDWKDCNDRRYAACFRDENDTKPRITRDARDWGNSVDYCFHHNDYPVSNRNMLSLLGDKNYWTAYINTLIISDSEEVVTSEVYKYGYIEREGDVLYLSFTEDSKEEMIAICRTEPTRSTVKATTNTQSTEVTTKLANASNRAKQPPHTEAQVSGDDKTVVYVAVPLVIIVCGFVAVVVVVFYRKKRSQQPKESDHNEILPRGNLTYNNVEDEVCYMNTIDQTGGLSLASENSTYISKKLQQAKIDPKLDIQSQSTDITDARVTYEKVDEVSAVYSKVDTTDVISAEQNTIPSDQATNTYYNTADYNMDVDNYDHIGGKHITAKDDGHYDTTILGSKGESFYDTTYLSAPRHAVNDDIYNTTDCPTDSDYVNDMGRKDDNYANANCDDVYADVDDN